MFALGLQRYSRIACTVVQAINCPPAIFFALVTPCAAAFKYEYLNIQQGAPVVLAVIQPTFFLHAAEARNS
jgi:hypothetical protein